MKDLKHIKKFNESDENLNISDVRSSENSTWDDIFEEYFQNYKEKYDMDIWLKEHYNVPIKKK